MTRHIDLFLELGWVNIGLLAAGLWLIVRTANILRRPAGAISFRLAFKHINLYVCWVISLLALNGIVGSQ